MWQSGEVDLNNVNYITKKLMNRSIILSHTCRNLRTSVAGKMVINITIALLAHQVLLLVREILYFTYIHSTVINEYYWLISSSLYYTLLAYFVTVLMFLFAAEAVNLSAKIVLIFSEIEHYVIKATLIAWSELLYSHTCMF